MMLTIFVRRLGPAATGSAISKCLLTGARFDASVAAYWAIPCLLGSGVTLFGLGRAWAERLRRWIAGLFAGLSTCLGVLAIGFFSEYKEHFNHWIFGVVFDDRRAELKTV